MFKIISDSACDLSQAYIEKNNIDIVPLSVSFDGENYFLDGVDITRNECYQRMVDNPKTYPKTSLPSVDLFYKAFEMYVKEDIPVVCFTISLIFSGSYNSARNAKELILEEYPNAEIHIIDSKQNTVTQGLIVDQMAKMRDNNVPLETALEKIEKVIASARIFFTVGSLDYLQMGGRIRQSCSSSQQDWCETSYNYEDGDIGLGGIGRNRNKLKKKVLEVADKYLTENGKDNFVISVGYGYDASEGVSFMNQLEETLNVKLQRETNVAIGIVSGVHTGPHPIGLGVVKKYETV